MELDGLFFYPGWVRVPPEVFRQRVIEATEEDGWVAAGNYSAVRDVLWPRAGTVIWLDLSLRVVLPRIFQRSWRRWRTKELLWGTNYERFWPQFLPNDDSIAWFTLRTFRRRRRTIEVAMTDPEWAHLAWIRLKSQDELDEWLANLPGSNAAQSEH